MSYGEGKKIGTLLSCSAKLFNILSLFIKERVSNSILLSTSLCFFLLGMQINQSKLLLQPYNGKYSLLYQNGAPYLTSTPFFVCFSPEHSNYFGTDDKLGVVAVSIRREKLDDTKELKDQYQYRLIIRTSEV